MKKLLSLLSVLTISGTAIPTTIAASSYQKEEALNSEINSSQTNNLESLNRNKRQIIEVIAIVIGIIGSAVTIGDSIKNDGVAKDVIDATTNHYYNQQQDFQDYGWFGGDGSY